MTKPIVAIFVIAALGVGLLCGGIFLVAGPGWALIVGSLPFLGAAFVLIRGMSSV